MNQLARNMPDELAAYLDLAGPLRAAQVRAAGDENARTELRELDRERRTRLAGLLDHAGAHRDDVERALAVAMVDGDTGTALRAGHLERIPDAATGFAQLGEELGAELAARPPRPRAAESRAETRRRERARQLDDDEREARVALRAAQEQSRSAERELREAERRVERIERERSRLDR